MKFFRGRRGLLAVLGLLSLVMGPSAALAKSNSAWDIAAAVRSVEAGQPALAAIVSATPPVAMAKAATAMTSAIRTVSGSLLSANTSVEKEAAWLHRGGWPLYALVDRYADNGATLNEQANCIAVAVYHEARGESLEGQLAVARVIMNRAASGKYPPSWCATVKQPWQFSFVNPRSGQFPYTNTNCDAWRKAVAITKLATSNVVPTLATDVLWYHADYVAPSWGRRMQRVDKIGTHIFYRA
ncbi:MAG: cell wall hydrolase [Sphingomicrobium sp.]